MEMVESSDFDTVKKVIFCQEFRVVHVQGIPLIQRYQCSASRLFLQGAAPCPFLVTPCLFLKAEMTPCPFDPFFLISGFVLFVVHTQRVLCCASFIVPFKGTFG